MAQPLRVALLSLLLLVIAPASALANHNVTIVSGTAVNGFTVTTGPTGTTYSANTDDATVGADTIASDLATGPVTVNTGSGPGQNGTITVGSAVTTAPTATGTLTLNANDSLTVNATMDIAGQLDLNSPLATTINQPINAFVLLTDNNGEYFVNANVSAVGEVLFYGQTSSLDATVTSQASEVDFLGPVFLGGDSTVDAATQVSMSTSLDGAYALTVGAGDEFVLGYTGGAIQPTSLSVTGKTTMFGDTISVNGPVTFNGDVNRSGSATFRGSDIAFHGALTAGDVVMVPTGVATFANGSQIGTEAAPLTSIEVDGSTSLGDTTVRTTGTQIWNGTVAVAGSASTIAADTVNFGTTVDGPGSLSVDSESHALSFNGSIGATTALAGLTVAGTQMTSFTGDKIAAGSASIAGLDLSLDASSSVALSVGLLSVGSGGISINNFPSHTVTVTGGGSISGPVTGTQTSLTKAGTGTLVLGGANSYEGQTTVNAGDLRINGSIPGDVALHGGVLSGTGTIGGNVDVVAAGVSPGASPGLLSISNDVTFDAMSTFTVELNGTTAGTGYDQLAVDGQLSLGSAALHVTAADSLPVGVPLLIINKTSGLDITGTFAGRPEGAVFDVGSVRLKISYTAGVDKNDVTLTRLKQPTSLALASGPANATEGSAVTLTAMVSGPAGTPAPTGTVTFHDGSTVLGTAPVSAGVATLTTSALAAGDHSLSAGYSGDFYDPSSATAAQHIEAKPAPVTENPPPVATPTTPAPSIKVADGKGKEKPKPGFVTFVVTLSKASAKTVTVKFATRNGTAKSGQDFKAARGTLTFKPGQTRMLVKVRIVNDKRPEKTEKFRLTLSGAAGATLARGTATGTILDDD